MPVLVRKEGTIGPHPLTFLEEIVSTNPDRGFSVNDRLDLILFSRRSDGSKVSTPGSAGLLGIGPVELSVRDILESGLRGNSLTDELILLFTLLLSPLSVGSLHGDAILTGTTLLALGKVRESELFVGRPGELSFIEEIVSTNPSVSVLGVLLEGLHEFVVLNSVVDSGKITSPLEAELSGISPGLLEVVESVLLLTVSESLGGLPSGRSGLSSNSSLADVSGLSGTVSVVPLASGVRGVDLSTAFRFGGSSEPVPSHLSAVSPLPVILLGLSTDPSSSNSRGTSASVVLSYESVGNSLLRPGVDLSEITTPGSANVSGLFPGLLVSSEEELELVVLRLESHGSLANVRHLMVARIVVPSMASRGFHKDTTHLGLVSHNLLRLSRSPVLISEAVLLGVIRPVPGSLNIEGISSHPGQVRVSDNLRDVVLFTVVLDRGKLSTKLRGTSGSSISPGLLGSEEFVVKFLATERSGVGVRLSILALLADESLLGVAVGVSELHVSLSVEVGSTTVHVSEGVGHTSVPVSVENTSLVSYLSVRPDPSVILLEIVVTNPGIRSLNLLEGSVD